MRPPPAQINASSRVALAHPSDAATPPAPTIVCRDSIWDFGTVDQTKIARVSHTFVLENVTDEVVLVDKVEAGCGCIVASDYPLEIAPHSSAGFPVTLNLVGPPRQLRKRVLVHLATSPRSVRALGVVGVIDASPAFYSAPSAVDFGTLAIGETRSRVVKIARFDASAVMFARGVARSGAVSLKRAASADDRDSVVELTVSLDASRLRAGDFASTVLVQTDRPEHPDFEIPIKARIAGEPDGLVRSIFVRKMRRGTSQNLPIANDVRSAEVERVSYEGAAPIDVELVLDAAERERVGPVVRILRKDDVSRSEMPKVVSGHLLVMVSGRDSRVRIPMFVQLAD